jgi:hypothetical protein
MLRATSYASAISTGQRAVALLILVSVATVAQSLTLHVHAQNAIIRIPAVEPGFLRWSTDGRYLAWVEVSGSQSDAYYVDNPNWRTYDLQTQQISTRAGYPFLPQLSSQEAAVLAPEPPDGGLGDQRPKVVFVSPSGRFLVFAGKRQTQGNKSTWKLMLGDRQRLQLLETGLELDTSSNLAAIDVKWSSDSSSFALSQGYDTSDISGSIAPALFVSGYSTNLANYMNQSQIAEPNINGQTYKTELVYDVSPDGQRVLVTGLQEQNNTGVTAARGFIVYSVQGTSILLPGIDGSTVTDAHFLASDPNHILMTAAQGLMLYDIAAQNFTVLNASLNGKDFFTRLSPRNDWAASINSNRELFLIPIKSLDLAGVLAATPTSAARLGE